MAGKLRLEGILHFATRTKGTDGVINVKVMLTTMDCATPERIPNYGRQIQRPSLDPRAPHWLSKLNCRRRIWRGYRWWFLLEGLGK